MANHSSSLDTRSSAETDAPESSTKRLLSRAMTSAIGMSIGTWMGWRNAEQEERSFLDSKDARRVVLDARTHELETSYRVVSGGVRDDLRRAIEAHDQAIGAFNKELMKHTRGEPPVKKVEVGNK